MQISWPPPGIGWIIAVIVFVYLLVLLAIGHVTLEALAGCVAALAVARLV